MADPEKASDYAALAGLSVQLGELQEHLAGLYAQWEQIV
jgi:hypothetical protein